MKIFAKQKAKKYVCLAFFLLYFFSFGQVLAKEVVLSSSAVEVEAGKTIEVRVNIDTESEKVGAVGFTIDFSTEILEGLTPNQDGSSFPMCATLSSTRYDCGITGQSGFSGQGLVTILVFRGRKTGSTQISLTNFEARFGPSGAEISGFSSNDITMTVIGEGQQPSVPKKTVTSTSSSGEELPAPTALSSTTTPPQAQLAIPGSITGSLPQVPGKIGSTAEEPLKVAGEADVAPSSAIKGIFFGQNKLYLSFFPTLLLLILAVFLGLRLYTTEKRRHLEIERLFDKQLGMLSALESKVGLIDQKGEGGKEKFVQEFEEARVEIEAIEKPQEDGKKEGNEQKAN